MWCNPFSNPNPQGLVQMLPCSEWGMHGFPIKKSVEPGVGWIGDAREWQLDVGGLGSRVFLHLQGKEPAPLPSTAAAAPPTWIARHFPGSNRSWVSFELPARVARGTLNTSLGAGVTVVVGFRITIH